MVPAGERNLAHGLDERGDVLEFVPDLGSEDAGDGDQGHNGERVGPPSHVAEEVPAGLHDRGCVRPGAPDLFHG